MSLAFADPSFAEDLNDIQRTDPIRSATFTGPHYAVARCVFDGVGGKRKGDEFGLISAQLVIYDSVKNLYAQGLTHYAFTILKTAPNRGRIEWRILPSISLSDSGEPFALTEAMIQRFWEPARKCAM